MNNLKRFLSVLVAAILVLSSFKSVDYITNAAQATTDSATYDFESDEKSFLDFASHWNTYNKDFDKNGTVDGAFAKVMTENEGTAKANKYLRIQNQTYKNLIVNFPYKLQNGASYRISYKIRDDGASNLNQSDTAGSGIYVGKATGNTTISSNQQRDVSTYLGAKLHNLYGGNGNYTTISNTAFTEVSYTFTVGASAVTKDCCYLAFNYYCTEKYGSAYEYIDIDDIEIERVSSIEFKAYVGDTEATDISIASILGAPGKKLGVDCVDVAGYDLVGIYTDPEFTTEFTESEFTIADTKTIYYVKYTAKEFYEYDFETDAKSFMDFASHWNTFGKDFNGDGEIDEVFAKVMTENEDTDQANKFLRIQNQIYKGFIVNFPYKLKNGASYRISYKMRSDGGLNLNQSATGGSGIYIGKATGNTTISAAQQRDVGTYLGTKLHNLYGGNGGYIAFNTTEFTDVSYTFTVGESAVTEDFCYLAINFFCAEKNGSAFEYIDIDDIKIEEISSIQFKAYVGDSETTEFSLNPVEGKPGNTVSLDCVSVAGYDVEGIYTDAAFTNKFTDELFTISEGIKTYYVKYVRNEEVYRFKMENAVDIKKNKDAAVVVDDPLNFGNHALAFQKNWRESIASFPYELKPNTTYALKLSYRSSSAGIVPRLYVYGVKGDSAMLETDDYNSKRLFSIMDFLTSNSGNSLGSTVTDNFGEWITKEYVFTTGDKVDDEYKYFALGGRVQHYAESDSEALLVDDIEIKKLDATVSFNVSYEGQKLDVATKYPSVGETITLPTSVIAPFELEGWYYDAAFTKAVGKTLTVTEKNTVLYGKVTKKNTYTIDFEDNTDLVDGWGNWFGIGSIVTTDPDNEENHVLKAQATGFGNYVFVRLNYQLQSNRIYEISVKYRGEERSATMALVASKIKHPENAMGIDSGIEKNRLQDSILPFVTQENVPANWQTASLKISTDQPEIDDDLKYLTVYFQNRVNTGSTNDKAFVSAYIDDITITDVGAYDPSKVVVDDAEKWTLPQEDTSIWKDWSSWITGKVEADTDETDGDNQDSYDYDDSFDYDYDFSGNDFEVGDGFIEDAEDTENVENAENATEQKPAKKKKVIKKVIVTQGSNTWIIVVVAAAVVLVGGGLTAFIIIKRKKNRKA